MWKGTGGVKEGGQKGKGQKRKGEEKGDRGPLIEISGYATVSA